MLHPFAVDGVDFGGAWGLGSDCGGVVGYGGGVFPVSFGIIGMSDTSQKASNLKLSWAYFFDDSAQPLYTRTRKQCSNSQQDIRTKFFKASLNVGAASIDYSIRTKLVSTNNKEASLDENLYTDRMYG